MIGLWFIGFVAGLIAGISPCILPVLPVVFVAWTASTPGDAETARLILRARRRRAVLVVTGLVVSFSVLTLAGTALLSALGLPDDFLRDAGIVLLAVIGVTMLNSRFEKIVEWPFSKIRTRQPSGRASGFALGLGLGAVFAPCAGPVLTAITVVGASKHFSFDTIVLTLFFATGAALPLLGIGLAGDTLIERNRALSARVTRFRPATGVLLILMALALNFNWLNAVQTWLPGYTSTLQAKVEGNTFTLNQLHELTHPSTTTTSPSETNLGQLSDCVSGASRLAKCGRAPNFTGITAWLHTKDDRPLTMASLRGKVVLIDFWTYSCINCERTLPHVEAWYKRYHKYGLDIIGVHSPEFTFEHVVSNVRSASKSLGVVYPVAVDNNLATWNAYNNEYWPADYLVDANGVVRHVDFGEGDYAQSEKLIRGLLKQASPGIELPPPTNVPNKTPVNETSPETYLGEARSQYLANGTLSLGATETFDAPSSVPQYEYVLGGTWRVGTWAVTAKNNSTLGINFLADDVYLVLGGTGTLTVHFDGTTKVIHVSGYPRLYTLESFSSLSAGTLHLSFTPGVQAYDFTFG